MAGTGKKGSGGRGQAAQAKAAEEGERFDALSELLTQLGFQVTLSRTLEGRGGDCTVKGARRVIVSRRLPVAERIDVLVDTLRRVDLEGVFVRPDLRDLIVPPPRPSAARRGRR